MAEVHVELRPHIGTQQTQVGPVQVEHAQREIYVTVDHGDHQTPAAFVGYVGTQPNAPINFHRQRNGMAWPEPIKQAVREHVAAELGEGGRKESQPPERLPAVEDDDDTDVMYEDDDD